MLQDESKEFILEDVEKIKDEIIFEESKEDVVQNFEINVKNTVKEWKIYTKILRKME